MTTKLDLGLARHGARRTERCKANGQASTDNTETVTDNSHDSSFDVRLLGAGYPNYLDRAKTARVTLMRCRES